MAKRPRKNDEPAQELTEIVAAEEAAVEKPQAKAVPGRITLVMETPDGKKVEKTYCIRPGIPYVRLKGIGVVSTEALMKVATGLEVEEMPLSSEAARDAIAHLAAIGSHLLQEID